jgi:THO complex subunit 4
VSRYVRTTARNVTNTFYSKPKTAAQEKTKGAAAKGAKGAANGAAGTAKAGANKKKAGRAGKPKAKTAEELDAEMQDYFGGNETNGAAPAVSAAPQAAPATNDDANMDEIS